VVGLPLFVLPLGDERTASSRARVYALLPHLARAGVDCRVLNPHDPRALAQVLARSAEQPTLVLQKRLLDDRWLHRLRHAGVRLVFDIDDAYFAYAPNESPAHPVHRRRVAARRRRLVKMVQASAVTVCGNTFLGAYARAHGARNVVVIPTCLDLAAYPPKEEEAPTVPVIGWIGSSTNLPYLTVVRPALAGLHRRGIPFVFSVVCDRAPDWPDLPVRFRPWTADGWSTALRTFDIGVMPLFSDDWARGKCGFKLLEYLATGIPAVASPVGVNGDIVRHGENALLAATPKEWEACLERLLADPALRRRLGTAGRRTVEAHYTTEKAAAQWLALLQREGLA